MSKFPFTEDYNSFPLVLDQIHTPKHELGKVPILCKIRDTLGKEGRKIKTTNLFQGPHLNRIQVCLTHTTQLLWPLRPVNQAGGTVPVTRMRPDSRGHA